MTRAVAVPHLAFCFSLIQFRSLRKQLIVDKSIASIHYLFASTRFFGRLRALAVGYAMVRGKFPKTWNS
jgi:hypothetical protein